MKAILTIWLLLITVGIYWLLEYSQTSGEGSPLAPKAWISPENYDWGDPNLAKLLVFIHPKCSCSESTLSELERLAPVLESRASIHTIFVLPNEDEEFWKDSSLYKRAKNNSSFNIKLDKGQELSKMFDAHTSGISLLYDGNDRLVFNGGLTSARAHEGPSTGNIFIRSWAENDKKTSGALEGVEAFVYGCELHDHKGLKW